MVIRSVLPFLLVMSMILDHWPVRAVPRPPRHGCGLPPWEQLGIRLLDCDEESGRIVLALGDPATARHVAVLVPGMDADLRHLEDPVDPHRGPLGWVRAIRSAAGPLDRDVAVVLWIGYRTPQTGGVEAFFGRAARAAATPLARFVAGLRAGHRSATPPHVSVIGHSYGAVVVATAAPGLPLTSTDDVVLLASPGARAGSAAALGTPARIWAGTAAADWVRWVPPVRIGDLGHGPAPTSPGFGARPLATGGVPAHDRYFLPGSPALAALADVVLRSAGASPGISP